MLLFDHKSLFNSLIITHPTMLCMYQLDSCIKFVICHKNFIQYITHIMILGDSPKIAGCMDLFRVQGRWGASARLAWIRCILQSVNDVSDGQALSKESPNLFPSPSYFSGTYQLHVCFQNLVEWGLKKSSSTYILKDKVSPLVKMR
jgi:hypothetical protein